MLNVKIKLYITLIFKNVKINGKCLEEGQPLRSLWNLVSLCIFGRWKRIWKNFLSVGDILADILKKLLKN